LCVCVCGVCVCVCVCVRGSQSIPRIRWSSTSFQAIDTSSGFTIGGSRSFDTAFVGFSCRRFVNGRLMRPPFRDFGERISEVLEVGFYDSESTNGCSSRLSRSPSKLYGEPTGKTWHSAVNVTEIYDRLLCNL